MHSSNCYSFNNLIIKHYHIAERYSICTIYSKIILESLMILQFIRYFQVEYFYFCVLSNKYFQSKRIIKFNLQHIYKLLHIYQCMDFTVNVLDHEKYKEQCSCLKVEMHNKSNHLVPFCQSLYKCFHAEIISSCHISIQNILLCYSTAAQRDQHILS